MLSDKLSKDLRLYIRTIREAGGVVNTSIVIAAGTGIVQHREPMSLECNGGHIALKKSWAKYFLRKMNFVKRKATTKSKLVVKNFEEVRYQFLLDIKAVVEMAEIPYDLIINWDQTGIKYIPVSEWTMEKEGSKRVEIAGINDKRQITAVFAGSLTGDFLPVQLVYKGTTTKCLPSVSFPPKWHITATHNHWCNEDTMVEYISKIIFPYLQEKKTTLKLPPTYPSLVIFDEFSGQVTDRVLSLLKANNIFYVIVPPNCTDTLQPLDVSVNKPAKDFLRAKFNEWYAAKITEQLGSGPLSRRLQPVDLRLSIVKPVGARWMFELYDYLKSRPEIVVNSFRHVGILDIFNK